MHENDPAASIGRGLGTSTVKAFIAQHGDKVTRQLVDTVWGTTGKWSPENKFTDWPDEKKAALIKAMQHYDVMIDDPGVDKRHRVFVRFHGEPGTGKTLTSEFLRHMLHESGFVVEPEPHGRKMGLRQDDEFVVVLSPDDRERMSKLTAEIRDKDTDAFEAAMPRDLPQDGSKIAMQQRAVDACRAAHDAFSEAIKKAQDLGVYIPMGHVVQTNGEPSGVYIHDISAPLKYSVDL